MPKTTTMESSPDTNPAAVHRPRVVIRKTTSTSGGGQQQEGPIKANIVIPKLIEQGKPEPPPVTVVVEDPVIQREIQANRISYLKTFLAKVKIYQYQRDAEEKKQKQRDNSGYNRQNVIPDQEQE